MKTCYIYHIHRAADKGNFQVGYIGITVNPRLRFTAHMRSSKRENPDNVHLKNAMLAYDDIELTLISSGSKEDMARFENYLRPRKGMGWNIAPGGNVPYVGGLGNRTSGPEHHCYGKPSPLKGIPISEETRKKISSSVSGSKNGFYGKKHSDETRQRMSGPREKLDADACAARTDWVYIIDGVEYYSSRYAASCLNVSQPTIFRRCRSPLYPNWVRVLK